MLDDQSQIIISNKISKNDQLEYITKEYKDIKLKPNKLFNKKIKYNNPEQVGKHLEILSDDPIITIKTQNIYLELLSSKYIKFSINTPSTEGHYRFCIKIRNKEKGEYEEVLKFLVYVTNE